MKRFTIFAVLLVLVGVSTGFAIELKPSVSLSGNETLTLGMDLNTGAIGFTNDADATLQVNLVSDDSSDTHAGTGAIYGSITISNFDLYWVDGTENYNQDKSGSPASDVKANNPSVSATLFIPPFSIGLDAPSMTADVVNEIEANDGFDDFGTIVLNSIVDNEDSADFQPSYAGNGMSVRYTDPGNVFWVQGDVKTGLGYAGVVATEQTLAMGLEGSVTVAPVTFGVGGFYGFGYATNPINFYVSAKLTLEGIGTFSFGMDNGYTPSAATNAFQSQIFVSAQMNFNKEATAFLQAKGLYDTVYAGVNNHFDGFVDFEVPAGTILGDLKVSVKGFFLDVMSADIEYGAEAVVGYKVWSEGDMYILPGLTVGYGKPNAIRALDAAIIGATTDSIMVVKPNVEIGLTANPLSTLTVGWSSGNLLRTGAAGANLGALTMALKITY